MASIFDQYEASMVREVTNPFEQSANPFEQPPSRGNVDPKPVKYSNIRVADETPIFTRSKINFKPSNSVTHLAVNNNKLCMVMAAKTLLRIDLEKPDDTTEIEVTRSDDKVYKLFLDPSGSHLLLEMLSQDTLFFSKNSHKPKMLSKFKGHKVESVAWNRQCISDLNGGGATGPVLIGTSRGLIMECCIEAGEDTKFFGGSVDQYLKELFNLSKGDSRDCAITGLEVNPFPTYSGAKPAKYHILAITKRKLYQFVGRINPNSQEIPVFQNVFSPYLSGPPSFLDLPGGSGPSQLALFFKSKSQSYTPTQFAWMAGPGVYFGDITVPAVEDSTSSVISNNRLIPYPEKGFGGDDPFAPTSTPQEEILAICLTEFHMLILYDDRVKAICTLNEQVVYEDVFPTRYTPILGLWKDETKGTLWAYTEKAVFKYKVFNESRNVWRMFLNENKFDMAKEYCKDNPANMYTVFSCQAEYFFENRRFNDSALYFAMTRIPFEEVALKFVRAKQDEALRLFLLKKLEALKPAEKTQMSMLVTWLAELYLNELGKLKEEGSSRYLEVQEAFRNFLAQQNLNQCFVDNKKTIYELLISHGNIEDYVFFAVLMKDYERVITHHIQNECYDEALTALTKQNKDFLYYKFSPILMQYIPSKTVDAWIDMGRRLEPKRLIPSLINCTQAGPMYKPLEAIRYLEHCIDSLMNFEPSIHNYLLSLYVKHQPEKLSRYILEQGDSVVNVCYDVKYALRLCLDGGPELRKACVEIYTVMQMYEEAVALALKIDVDLAKSIANRPELEQQDEELKKKLWMLIAKHAVEVEKDIKRAMQFLQESGDLLKIEDILPFFPDFVTIDHFKDALCESLDKYNQDIKELKDEMNDSTESAHAIRADIQETRNHHLMISVADRCDSCSGVLLSRAFYRFPCTHSFHSDCLWKEVTPYLGADDRKKAEELQQDFNSVNQGVTGKDEVSAKERKSVRQAVMQQLDELLADECPLCGEIAINMVDAPLIDPENYDSIIKSWL